MDLTKILGARELRLLNDQETRYPQLARLNLDFGLCVLEAYNPEPQQKSFALVTPRHQQTDQVALTAGFPSLRRLEEYVEHHVAEILHCYVFDAAIISSHTGVTNVTHNQQATQN